VNTKSRTAKERETADLLAEMMYAALQKLPKIDQKAAVKAIQNIKITPNGMISS
jgi:hypothetical protein